MTARLYKLAYQLKVHRFGDWSLERWAATGLWLVAAVIVVQWLFRGRPPLPAWHWGVLGLLVLAALGWPTFRRAAAARGYVEFRPATGLALPAGVKMDPDGKVTVRATGTFEVGEKQRFFADLEAYWRTYGSREHAVLAKADGSRFLLVGNTPNELRGMWYLFFKPGDIRAIEAGAAAFGAAQGPGLRVAYMMTPANGEGKRARKPTKATTILRFASEADRDRVWADLRYDLAGDEPVLRHTGPTNGKLRL